MMRRFCICIEVTCPKFIFEFSHIDCFVFFAALDLSKDSKRNYGDEIAYQMRLARKKRWNVLEEKRIKQEIELQKYLNDLLEQDRDRQKEQLRVEIEGKAITDEEANKSAQQAIDVNFEEKVLAVNDLFAQIDDRRKVGGILLLGVIVAKSVVSPETRGARSSVRQDQLRDHARPGGDAERHYLRPQGHRGASAACGPL